MKKEKMPAFVIVAALTTLTTVFWVVISVYSKFRKVDSLDIPEELTKQINPKLDTDTLSQIENRFFVNDNDLPNTIVVEASQSAELIEELVLPTPTPSATPEFSTTEASESGVLQ